MLINELKEKSYFRYFQLLMNNCSDNQNLIRIFLLEKELIKIYYATEENILKKIKYKWLIDELVNSKSKFPLALELQKLDKVYVKKMQNYIFQFQKTTDLNINSLNILSCFSDISIILNELISETIKPVDFKTSYLFQFLHFSYFSNKNKNYNFHKENNYPSQDIEHCEKIFIKIFNEKIKNNKKLKISKIMFILRVLFNF